MADLGEAGMLVGDFLGVTGFSAGSAVSSVGISGPGSGSALGAETTVASDSRATVEAEAVSKALILGACWEEGDEVDFDLLLLVDAPFSLFFLLELRRMSRRSFSLLEERRTSCFNDSALVLNILPGPGPRPNIHTETISDQEIYIQDLLNQLIV